MLSSFVSSLNLLVASLTAQNLVYLFILTIIDIRCTLRFVVNSIEGAFLIFNNKGASQIFKRKYIYHHQYLYVNQYHKY
jgi:hypothetical protein